jgi:hypothetical protein
VHEERTKGQTGEGRRAGGAGMGVGWTAVLFSVAGDTRSGVLEAGAQVSDLI